MEDEVPETSIGWGILMVPVDLAPGALHQKAELHAGRSGRFAGPAEQAEVHVLREVVGDSDLSL